MNQNYLFSLIVVLFYSCGNETKIKNPEISDKESEIIEVTSDTDKPEYFEHEIETDSLGYPYYYTHPELNSTSELKKILESSDRVVAYNYNEGQENPAMMDDENQYLYNLKSKELISNAYNESKLQNDAKNQLINLLCDSANYSGHWSGLAGVCYIPHVGFGFFNNDSLIAQASFCFMCSGIRTNPFYKSDGLSAQGLKNFDAFVKEIGLEAVYR